jgi:type I restriction enzyme, S subunit
MQKQTSIPQLRFPEFKGEWEKKKLGEVAEKINSGKTPLGGESVYSDKGILFIRSQNVNDDKLSLENSTYISEKINDTMKNSVVLANDILLNITGASLGRSCVVPNDFAIGNVNQHVCIIRIDKKNNPNFIQPILSSEKGQNIFTSLQTGSGREGLNFQSIKGIEITFPTLPEQTKIAEFFTAIDAKIQALKKKKAYLQHYKKGVMQRIFNYEFNNYELRIRFKDDYGKEFPKWEKKKLGEVLSIGSGKDYKHLQEGNVPVFGTGGLMTFVNSFLYDGETVCIGRKGTIDKPFYHEGKIWTVDTLFFTHSFIKCLPKFIFYLFETINWKEYNEASGVPSLSKSTIEKIELVTPSLAEQTKIANFLSFIDNKITNVQLQITNMETWKKGMLQRMFV